MLIQYSYFVQLSFGEKFAVVLTDGHAYSLDFQNIGVQSGACRSSVVGVVIWLVDKS